MKEHILLHFNNI